QTTHNAGPSTAVTASGMASVTHSVITRLNTASSRCAGSLKLSIGKNQTMQNTTGATTKPIRRRQRSKQSSADLATPVSLVMVRRTNTQNQLQWRDELTGKPFELHWHGGFQTRRFQRRE